MADGRNKQYMIAMVMYLIVLLVICYVVFMTCKLILFPDPSYANLQLRYLQEKPKAAARGRILARDGRTLACTLPYYKINMDPTAKGLKNEVFNRDIDSLSLCLANLYKDHDAAYYKNLISRARHRGLQFITINNKRISYDDLQRVMKFPIFREGANRGGFLREEYMTRKLPFGDLASRTIGTVLDRRGNVGIENFYNKELSGTEGKYLIRKVGSRDVENVILEPEDGYDVVSTIDIDIQDVAEHSLMQQLQNTEADHGVAILMEVNTGAIRAMVNLNRTSDGRYRESYNYAIGEAGEPGSTFKLATVIACLEDGKIKDVDKDTINIFDGEFRFYDRIMRDSHKPDSPIVTISKAFEQSSNVAFSRLVSKHYSDDPQQFIDNLRALGLCDSLGIDLAGEAKTIIKNRGSAGWSGTTLPWMSIGYEVQISPLHLLTLYNAVANGGQMMRPMVVEGIMEHGEMIKTMRPKVLRSSIASRRTIETVRKMLEGVVARGTASNISNTKGYAIAGKTGTARIANKGSYAEPKYLASFAGYFPADNPKYSVIVSVTGPKNTYYGNRVAGTVVQAIANRVYAADYRKGNITQKAPEKIDGVYPYSKGGRLKDVKRVFSKLNIGHNVDITSMWVSTAAKDNNVQLKAHNIVKGMMPDVRGMGAADAVSLLESEGLIVQLTGYGRVVTQSISPGSKYVRGMTIVLELRSS